MSIHKKWIELTILEKIAFTGELIHLVETDEACFELAAEVIAYGTKTGKLKNVVINPDLPRETPADVVQGPTGRARKFPFSFSSRILQRTGKILYSNRLATR